MKPVTNELDAHFQGELTSEITCVKITQTKYQPRIVDITQANPGVVRTRWAHGFETGDVVRLKQIRGMTSLNRQEYLITKFDNFRFSIGVDTTAMDAYTHKGVAQKVFGFTQHYKDLVFENVTYSARIGYTPESIKQGSNMAVDTVEVEGILTNAAKNDLLDILIEGMTDEDFIAGRYEGAEMEYFKVNYLDLTQGRMNIISGTLGETTLHRGTYQAEFSSKTAKLQEMLQEVYTANCRADIGDDFDGSEPEHELQPGFGCKVRLGPPYWKASTAYTVRPAGDAGLGSVVKPAVENGRHFKCTTAGTSGLTEPAWNLAIGGTTADGTAVWTTIEGLTKTGIVHEVIDRRRFIDNDRNEAPQTGIGGVSTLFEIINVNVGDGRFTIAGDHVAQFPDNAKFDVVGSPTNDAQYSIESTSLSGGNTRIFVSEDIDSNSAGGYIVGRLPSLMGFFTYGRVTFLTGLNKGISREVRAFSVSTTDGVTFTGPGLFEMFEAFPFDIHAGDQYEAHAGCDHTLIACTGKFDNVHNRRAEDNIPGNDRMLLWPDPK